MVQIHYPVEAISDMPFSEGKLQLLEAQVIELSMDKQALFCKNTCFMLQKLWCK